MYQMGGKPVRDAMVKASAGNVSACLMLDKREGKYWTSSPAPDVANVLDELERLQAVEWALNEVIDRKRAEAAKEREEARRWSEIVEVERALVCKDEARKLDAEVMVLELIREGRGLG